MEAIAHSPEFAKKAGVPQSVGQDFANADKRRSFATGGNVNKNYMAKQESFAAGGPVLGRDSKFLKTENRFLGRKLPENGEAEETEDRFEKGAVHADVTAPAPKGKSLSPVKPRS